MEKFNFGESCGSSLAPCARQWRGCQIPVSVSFYRRQGLLESGLEGGLMEIRVECECRSTEGVRVARNPETWPLCRL